MPRRSERRWHRTSAPHAGHLALLPGGQADPDAGPLVPADPTPQRSVSGPSRRASTSRVADGYRLSWVSSSRRQQASREPPPDRLVSHPSSWLLLSDSGLGLYKTSVRG